MTSILSRKTGKKSRGPTNPDLCGTETGQKLDKNGGNLDRNGTNCDQSFFRISAL